ncbi:hypothetical protein A2U01_0102389, partial [Trifolium medium]|nr:hypothetical protein [Trifolium medium]
SEISERDEARVRVRSVRKMRLGFDRVRSSSVREMTRSSSEREARVD